MFCKLEEDQKTFEYMKTYLREWQAHHNIDELDKQITKSEIETHLRFHPCDSAQRNIEVLHWIKTNAQPFRAYLNTIKIAILAYHIAGVDVEDLTWEEFHNTRARVNQVKEELLDTIMIENVSNSA